MKSSAFVAAHSCVRHSLEFVDDMMHPFKPLVDVHGSKTYILKMYFRVTGRTRLVVLTRDRKPMIVRSAEMDKVVHSEIGYIPKYAAHDLRDLTVVDADGGNVALTGPENQFARMWSSFKTKFGARQVAKMFFLVNPKRVWFPYFVPDEDGQLYAKFAGSDEIDQIPIDAKIPKLVWEEIYGVFLSHVDKFLKEFNEKGYASLYLPVSCDELLEIVSNRMRIMHGKGGTYTFIDKNKGVLIAYDLRKYRQEMESEGYSVLSVPEGYENVIGFLTFYRSTSEYYVRVGKNLLIMINKGKWSVNPNPFALEDAESKKKYGAHVACEHDGKVYLIFPKKPQQAAETSAAD